MWGNAVQVFYYLLFNLNKLLNNCTYKQAGYLLIASFHTIITRVISLMTSSSSQPESIVPILI